MIRFPSDSSWLLAPVEHSIEFRRIRLVVNYAAFHFYPSVGFEWHLLRTNDHLGGHAVPFQKARKGSGSLQAECLFPIPDAGHVYRCADLLDGTRRWIILGDSTVANFVVERREVFSR
jgi:hypothetical protein